jgi:DNA-binding MltR family transcriptional regulator
MSSPSNASTQQNAVVIGPELPEETVEKILAPGAQSRVWVQQSDKAVTSTDAIDEVAKASDRAMAIVACALVDDQLFELLKRSLHDDTEVIDDMFGGLRPLATFSAKINLAYLIGLISERVFKDLHTIRKIRNDFAHGLNESSFKSQSMADRAMNLTLPDWFALTVRIKRPKTGECLDLPVYDKHVDDITDPRTRFLVTCRLLTSKFALQSPQRLTAPERGI